MSKFLRAGFSSLAALLLTAGAAHAGDGWGYVDLQVPEVVGETGGRTYDLNQRIDKDTNRFVGNQTVRGGTFVGAGLGVRVMYVFDSGVLIGFSGGGWGGRLQGADMPWASQSTATHYEMTTQLGYALSIGVLSLHAAALVGFDGMQFDVAGPLSAIAANVTSPSTSGGNAPAFFLSRFDLRAGLQIGAHVNVTELIAIFADGSYDYDGQWRVRGGIAIGQPKHNLF